ncbi:hypothetical protein BDZ97DRAFT_1761648 [Flammula alnicola]|nr:hypothetical protein BDZ97DRAFT_1761648 [Flammula alnicola]
MSCLAFAGWTLALLIASCFRGFATLTLSNAVKQFETLQSPIYSWKAPDFPQELPGLDGPETAMFFTRNDTTQYPLDDNDAWNTIIPPKLGVFRIGPKGRRYGLSLYHQLHCLNSIRYDYMVARLGLLEDVPNELSHHDTHCMHFIRQGIMCHADTTLIPLEEESGTETSGEWHRCRGDWTNIRTFIEDLQAKWKGVPLTHAFEDAD